MAEPERLSRTGTIGERLWTEPGRHLHWPLSRDPSAAGALEGVKYVFRHKKPPQVQHTDLIDLLLDSDEPTRRLLIFQALQAGSLKKSEAEEVMATVSRLERVAGPRTDPIARKALAMAAAAAEATTQQLPAQEPAKAA